MNININLAEFGGVIAALLVVGAILKNAFPNIPNRVIPAITWILGVLAYLTLAKGWADPQQWLAAIVAAATATGVHSGIKNTVKSEQPTESTDKITGLILIGSLLLFTGCANFYRSAATLTAAVDAGAKEYATAYNNGLVSESVDVQVERAHASYRQAAKTAATSLRAYKLSQNESDYAEAFANAQLAAMQFVNLIVPFVTETKAKQLQLSVEKARAP